MLLTGDVGVVRVKREEVFCQGFHCTCLLCVVACKLSASMCVHGAVVSTYDANRSVCVCVHVCVCVCMCMCVHVCECVYA